MAQVLAPTASPQPAVDERPPNGPPASELPYLAEGVELVGRYEDSGYQEDRYLIRRADGQVVQVSELIFLVAAGLDMTGDPHEVAAGVSARFGRDVSVDNVMHLVDHKLRPAGLIWSPGDTPPPARANPLLALRMRLPLVPEPVHRRVTSALTPLFWPPVIVAVLAAFLAFDVWLVTELGGGMIGVARALIYLPHLLLPLTGLLVVMGLFHEAGHAAAARYGGATPGAMGAGIYLVWPVFYTDVTDAYRLNRRGRLRTDLGGVYFNVLFMLAAGAMFLLTGHVLFLVFVLLAHLETLRQFLPFVRFDGYHIVSDLAGVPNLFGYMGPALASATRRLRRSGNHAPRTRPLEALTRKARIVLVVWACITAPVLAVNVVMLAMIAPHIGGAAWGSAGVQFSVLRTALGHGDLMTAAERAVSLGLLLLPAAGVTYILCRLARRLGTRVGGWWQRRPLATAGIGIVAAAALVLQVGWVWPDAFLTAAREPGQRHAQAEAAASAAEARDALARGARTAAGAVVGVAPARRTHLDGGARPMRTPDGPPALASDPPRQPAPAPAGGQGPAPSAGVSASAGLAPPSSAPAAPPGPQAATPAPAPAPGSTAPAPAPAPTRRPTPTTTNPPPNPLDDLLSVLGG